jgi:nucleoside-diphosphate-sugar epimerase
MNILITGSTGFVGQNLTLYLRNTKLNLYFVSREELSSVSANCINGQKIEVIIHLAGKAHDLKTASKADEYYHINYEFTKRLYNEFLQSSARKFIFISSVKAAADSVDEVLYENIMPKPTTDYGKSKLMAENYIQNQPLPKEKSFYILRPCMIHGPGNKGNLNLLFKLVKSKIPYPFADFENKRSFLSVENLCFIIYQLIINDCIESGIYNVSDDEALSTNKVVSVLAASLNSRPRLWKIPKGMVRFVARIGNVLRLPLTTDRLNKLTENYIVSNQKIKNAIKLELPITSIEGLKITADSFISA